MDRAPGPELEAIIEILDRIRRILIRNDLPTEADTLGTQVLGADSSHHPVNSPVDYLQIVQLIDQVGNARLVHPRHAILKGPSNGAD